MKPPKRVQVGPHSYRVSLIDAALPDAGCDGICSKARLSISVYSEQGSTKLGDTLCHELTHAMLAQVKLEDDVEESICLALGPALLALVRDNPKLIEWLKGLPQ